MSGKGTFTFVVDYQDEAKRLDQFIASHLPDCSRTYAALLIRKGTIRVQEEIKKPGYRVKTDEKITAFIPSPEPASFKPEPIPIDILHEDDHIIIVNKAAGMVVHPAPGNYTGTLVNGLLYHCPDIKSIGGEQRPGIVHRLDKETSGVLVVAKNHEAHINLSAQFKSRQISKTYLALVAGKMEQNSGRITFPIGRHPTERKKMSIHSRKPRSAETLWMIRERFKGYCFLEISIKTGRTHQIRVHCAAINNPVMGDAVYGGRRVSKNLTGHKQIEILMKTVQRQMLHSWQIGFIHPQTDTFVKFEAPMPTDMTTVTERLRSLAE